MSPAILFSGFVVSLLGAQEGVLKVAYEDRSTPTKELTEVSNMSATRETPRHMKASDCGHFCDPVVVGLRPGERPTFCSQECLARSVASLDAENAKDEFGENRFAAVGSSALASIVTDKLVHGD